jgi:hypothetical protein
VPLAVFTLHLLRAVCFHFKVCKNLTHAVVSILFSLQNPRPPSGQYRVRRRILRLSLCSTAASYWRRQLTRSLQVGIVPIRPYFIATRCLFTGKVLLPNCMALVRFLVKGKALKLRIHSRESRRCVVTLFHFRIVWLLRGYLIVIIFCFLLDCPFKRNVKTLPLVWLFFRHWNLCSKVKQISFGLFYFSFYFLDS